jgi:uracil-DNA glycosylase
MDSRQRHYLEVMGIDVWESRDAPDSRAKHPPVAESAPKAAGDRSQVTGESFVEEARQDTKTLSPSSAENLPAKLDWDSLEQRVSACTLCEELVANRSQTVFGVGNRNADWLIIGEAPGADEDRQGEPFVGRAGQLLNAMLQGIGLQRQQVYIANILKCRPPNNRDPRPDEAAACHAYLQRQIELIQPKLVLAVGRIAAQNLLKCDTPIGKLRGQVHRLENNLPLVVTYHPAYLLRSPLEKRKAWADLCLARRTLRELRGAGQ